MKHLSSQIYLRDAKNLANELSKPRREIVSYSMPIMRREKIMVIQEIVNSYGEKGEIRIERNSEWLNILNLERGEKSKIRFLTHRPRPNAPCWGKEREPAFHRLSQMNTARQNRRHFSVRQRLPSSCKLLLD